MSVIRISIVGLVHAGVAGSIAAPHSGQRSEPARRSYPQCSHNRPYSGFATSVVEGVY